MSSKQNAMGGEVSKTKLVDPLTGKPTRYYTLEPPFDWLCGGAIPAYRESINHLVEQDVGLVISLTANPVVAGKNCGMPLKRIDRDGDEWVMADTDLFEAAANKLTFVHLETDDGYAPPLNKLIDTVLKYRATSNKKVYVHCWKGSGRSSTGLIFLVGAFCYESLTLKEATALVKRANPTCSLTDMQQLSLETAYSTATALAAIPFHSVEKKWHCFRCYRISDLLPGDLVYCGGDDGAWTKPGSIYWIDEAASDRSLRVREPDDVESGRKHGSLTMGMENYVIRFIARNGKKITPWTCQCERKFDSHLLGLNDHDRKQYEASMSVLGKMEL